MTTTSPQPWMHISTDGVFDAHARRLASTSFTRRRGASMRLSNEERDSNGMLMAAAPDLRDALIGALDVLHACADIAGDVPFWNRGGEGYTAAARARALLASLSATNP